MARAQSLLAPARRRALLLTWVVRAGLGWLVALPLLTAVGGSGVGALPIGDRALFEPGALFLLELLYRESHALLGAVRASALLLVLAFVAHALTTALLFASARSGDDRLAPSGERALREGFRFLGLGGLELLTKLILVGLASLAFDAITPGHSQPGLKTTVAQGLVVLVGAATFVMLSLLADCWRAELSRTPRRSTLRSFEDAAAQLLPRGLELAGAWMLCAGAGVTLVAGAARLTEALNVGLAGAFRITLVLLLHQAVIFGLCALQAWFVDRVVAGSDA